MADILMSVGSVVGFVEIVMIAVGLVRLLRHKGGKTLKRHSIGFVVAFVILMIGGALSPEAETKATEQPKTEQKANAKAESEKKAESKKKANAKAKKEAKIKAEKEAKAKKAKAKKEAKIKADKKAKAKKAKLAKAKKTKAKPKDSKKEEMLDMLNRWTSERNNYGKVTLDKDNTVEFKLNSDTTYLSNTELNRVVKQFSNKFSMQKEMTGAKVGNPIVYDNDGIPVAVWNGSALELTRK